MNDILDNIGLKKRVSKLDPIIKEKWLKALRSGDYKQGEGYLYNSRRGKHYEGNFISS